MRYGRRRRGFPWAKAIILSLAILGAVSLLMVAVNWRSVLGLYRINLVGGGVRTLTGTVDFDPARLRAHRLGPDEARTKLEQGLTDLGVPARLTTATR